MNRKVLILVLVNLFFIGGISAQIPLEFAAGSMNPIPNGPTAASQSANLLANPSGNTFNPTNPPVTVTASLSNQQYTGVNTGSGNPVVMFGATSNTANNSPQSVPTFALMSALGAPVNSNFSNTVSGTATGIDVSVNYAFNMFTSVQHWETAPAPATTARVYMADLTLTFSQPLTNPYLQLVAKGGNNGQGLGLSTELTLLTSGLTLTKIVGTDSLQVSSSQINNGNATGINTSCANNSAACGTVRLNGTSISSVTFQVYVRGDGGSANWTSPTFHTGDQWLLGVSVPEGVATASAGEISGSLMKNGEPLRRVLVALTDAGSGQQKFVYTDGEGVYRFEELEIGHSYIVEPLSRRFAFNPKSTLVNMNDSIAGLNFFAESLRYKPFNDFDGDGKSDAAVFRPADGNWSVLNSSTGLMSDFRFGAEGDQPAAGDYDGDGRTDYAVYRPADGFWYIWQSATRSFRAEKFGLATDRIVPGDYDGDNKTDIAVFRDGLWCIQKSVSREVSYFNFGLGSDQPVPADFDGDGLTDTAVFREGEWHIFGSATGYRGAKFGSATDKPVPADFDGDGRADIAVFRAGEWHVSGSSIGYKGYRFGIASDKPVAADYDGDGQTDAAVFRAEDGASYQQRSETGFFGAVIGKNTDIPVQNFITR